jgi:hypothetical protein
MRVIELAMQRPSDRFGKALGVKRLAVDRLILSVVFRKRHPAPPWHSLHLNPGRSLRHTRNNRVTESSRGSCGKHSQVVSQRRQSAECDPRGSIREDVYRAPALLDGESVGQHQAVRRAARHHDRPYVADHGKSGLRVDGRDALKQLIDDVQAGPVTFSVILVYDVSRWGRFQDADESAYYEFICKEAGIAVHYCAEQFENDGSLSATIIKGMKRAMAGEYSRELSTKVFAGQCRLITLGFGKAATPATVFDGS